MVTPVVDVFVTRVRLHSDFFLEFLIVHGYTLSSLGLRAGQSRDESPEKALH